MKPVRDVIKARVDKLYKQPTPKDKAMQQRLSELGVEGEMDGTSKQLRKSMTLLSQMEGTKKVMRARLWAQFRDDPEVFLTLMEGGFFGEDKR